MTRVIRLVLRWTAYLLAAAGTLLAAVLCRSFTHQDWFYWSLRPIRWVVITDSGVVSFAYFTPGVGYPPYDDAFLRVYCLRLGWQYDTEPQYFLPANYMFGYKFKKNDAAERMRALDVGGQWPVLVLITPALVTTAVDMNRRRRTRRVVAAGQCAVCGYDLTDNASGTCPECGSSIPTAYALARLG